MELLFNTFQNAVILFVIINFEVRTGVPTDATKPKDA
jgi:hypothetical protein